MRIALFAAGDVGAAALDVMLRAGLEPAALVAEPAELESLSTQSRLPADCRLSANVVESPDGLRRLAELDLDLGILAWWPRILRMPLLAIPRLGYLNFHPSYLPYDRGKHYNFWTIVDSTPFGVTIHWVSEGVDDGDIAFQRRLDKSWEDTGESLYHRARTELVSLFSDSLGQIRAGDIPRHPQPAGVGVFHSAKELEPASRVDLDQRYTARSLLNVLRARTFPPHPGAWFEDAGVRYEVEIRIRRIT